MDPADRLHGRRLIGMVFFLPLGVKTALPMVPQR
jgi:hypothetical protein